MSDDVAVKLHTGHKAKYNTEINPYSDEDTYCIIGPALINMSLTLCFKLFKRHVLWGSADHGKFIKLILPAAEKLCGAEGAERPTANQIDLISKATNQTLEEVQRLYELNDKKEFHWSWVKTPDLCHKVGSRPVLRYGTFRYVFRKNLWVADFNNYSSGVRIKCRERGEPYEISGREVPKIPMDLCKFVRAVNEADRSGNVGEFRHAPELEVKVHDFELVDTSTSLAAQLKEDVEFAQLSVFREDVEEMQGDVPITYLADYNNERHTRINIGTEKPFVRLTPKQAAEAGLILVPAPKLYPEFTRCKDFDLRDIWNQALKSNRSPV